MGRVCSFVDEDEDVHVLCTQCDGGPPHTGVIAGWEDVAALAQGAKYQGGIARLEINGEFGFGASTVSLMVRKVSMYFMIIWSPQVLQLCRHLYISELNHSN